MAGTLPSLSNLSIQEISGAKNFRYAILSALWHLDVTEQLVKGSLEILKACKVPNDSILIETVPGSFELPLAANYILQSNLADAVICLGCIIQGETKHDEIIANTVSQACMQLSIQFAKPVIFGVLTVHNLEQALERSGGKFGNKGCEAAIAAIKMLELHNRLHDNLKKPK